MLCRVRRPAGRVLEKAAQIITV